MRILWMAALALVSTVTVVACGSPVLTIRTAPAPAATAAQHVRSTSTTVTRPAAPSPTPVTEPGEAPAIAGLAERPPEGYVFLRASQDVVEAVVNGLLYEQQLADLPTEELFGGASIHFVGRASDHKVVAAMILVQIPPYYWTTAGAEEALVAGFAGEAGATGAPEPTSVGGESWWVASFVAGQQYEMYMRCRGDVVIVLEGTDPALLQQVILATLWMR